VRSLGSCSLRYRLRLGPAVGKRQALGFWSPAGDGGLDRVGKLRSSILCYLNFGNRHPAIIPLVEKLRSPPWPELLFLAGSGRGKNLAGTLIRRRLSNIACEIGFYKRSTPAKPDLQLCRAIQARFFLVRRWPSGIASQRAFCLRAPGVRLSVLEMAFTRVLFFECCLSSLTSARVQARRTTRVFLAIALAITLSYVIRGLS